MNFIRRYAVLASVATLCAGSAFAQEPATDEVDPKELMRQIKRNLTKIEDDLQKVESSSASAKAAGVKEDMDKLVETMRRRQDQVTKDIDEMVKQMKAQQGGSGSGSSQSKSKSGSKSQSGGKSKNRNQSEGGKKGDQPQSGEQPQGGEQPDGEGEKGGKENKPGSKGGKKPKPGEKEPGSEGNPEGGGKGGKQENKQGPRPNDPKARVVVRPNINEVWGRLPKEVRQKLTDKNFEDFTPEYEAEVKEYLRRTNVVDK